jgi:Uncharacterised nucleotidyltransferase
MIGEGHVSVLNERLHADRPTAPKHAWIARWSAHRAALAPVLDSESLPEALALLRKSFADDAAIRMFLSEQGLCGVWYIALTQRTRAETAEEDIAFTDSLRPIFLADTAMQALQNRAIKLVTDYFDNNHIAFVFLKTAGLRDELYNSLGLRPCTDIDLLVAPSDRVRAMAALQSLGAECVESGDRGAHETTWRLGLVDLDLHWDILGAGRLPSEFTQQVLSRRVRTACGWRPDNADCFFIALVHPAFAKHVCSRHMGLNRVNDTVQMLDRFQFDASTLQSRLRQAGVLLAARASAYWLDLLIDDDKKMRKIKYLIDKPVTLREHWLRFCIRRNLPNRWVEKHRIFLNLVFTNLLHDSVWDMSRATRGSVARAMRGQNAGRAT